MLEHDIIEQATGSDTGSEVRIATVCAVEAGMLAAWIAAGSTGVLADPLRIAMTWLALIVLAASMGLHKRWQPLLLLPIVVLIALPLVIPVSSTHEVFLVAAVVSLFAAGAQGVDRSALSSCALAVLTLAIFRFACESVSVVWMLSDIAGAALGQCAAAVTGKPLDVGATFGGVDFLVLMAAFLGTWLWKTSGRRRRIRAAWAAFAILIGHLLYLVLVALALDIAGWLPEGAKPEFTQPYTPLDWDWSAATKQLLPWNLPAVAAVFHLTTATFMLRWVSWKADGVLSQELAVDAPSETAAKSRSGSAAAYFVFVLAFLSPIAGTLSFGRCDLSGKTIVASGQGRVDWNKPEHDRYGQESAGMFGMLPLFVESLGGRLLISSDLSPQDLAEADVLLLLHPTGPMAGEMRERILEFVRQGGSLLLAAEPVVHFGDVASNFNDALEPTGMRVRQDVAISETRDWQQAMRFVAHAVTSGLDTRRSFFTDAATSIRVRWPGRPIVIGRWGWSDPGSDAVLTSVHRFEAGEKLGDVVLAAEQRLGKGTIVVLGDSVSLTNEGGVHGYLFAGRLLSYLAGRIVGPQTWWRQWITVLLCVGLLGLTIRLNSVEHRLWIAVLMGVSLALSGAISRHSLQVIPDGRKLADNPDGTESRLAYIDASHVEPYSDSSWTFDAINGLTLTLMRNGYLTLMAPDITPERLERAGLLVLIAPARRFSADERKAISEYVEQGGVLICTIGAEEAGASESLLAEFGMRVPASPVPTVEDQYEPEPMGHIRSLFLDANDYGVGDYRAGVVFHSGWPVEADGGAIEVLVRAVNEKPVVICRQFGRGKVVVIGDTEFAMNKNLEYVGGDPFNGQYENAHFWRWLISRVANQPEWIPPKPPDEAAVSADPVQEAKP